MKFDVNAYKTGTWKFPPYQSGDQVPAGTSAVGPRIQLNEQPWPNVCALCDHLATVSLKRLE